MGGAENGFHFGEGRAGRQATWHWHLHEGRVCGWRGVMCGGGDSSGTRCGFRNLVVRRRHPHAGRIWVHRHAGGGRKPGVAGIGLREGGGDWEAFTVVDDSKLRGNREGGPKRKERVEEKGVGGEGVLRR